ncbi:MAG: hypothetical protein K8R69_01160, partial [Deltaproteobacteria bacterium]|nr:hypothetical protein [Deltaproteobacteria bacterium]
MDRKTGEELVELLAKRKGGAAYMSFSHLAANWMDLEKTKFSHEQKIALLLKLGGKESSRMRPLTDELRVAIPKLEALGWGVEEQYRFLVGFNIESGREIDLAFYNAPLLVQKMSLAGWSREQIETVLEAIKTPNQPYPGTTLEKLSLLMDYFQGLSWPPTKQLRAMLRLMNDSKESLNIAVNLFRSLVGDANWSAEQALELIHRMSKPLSIYNRGKVLSFLLKHLDYLRSLGQEPLEAHLDLYHQVLQRWPRLGLNLLEDLVEATQLGLIPADPTPERERIFRFISATHRLVPAFYRIYLREGEPFLTGLAEQARSILGDQWGIAEMKSIASARGEDFLLGLLHMASPTSGSSFVAKAEHGVHLKKMMEAGDLRRHLPKAWSGKKRSFEIGHLEWRLRQGQEVDSDGRMAKILAGFQNRWGQNELREEDAVTALAEYLGSGRQGSDREKFDQVFFRFAGQNQALWEHLYQMDGINRTQLHFLEELFSDRDQLPAILTRLFEKVPEELKQASVDIEQHPFYNFEKYISNLKKIERQPKDERRKILPRLLQSVDLALAETLLLGRPDFSSEFKEELRAAIREIPSRGSQLSANEVITEILNRDLAAIRGELTKYQYQETRFLNIGVRPVKGPGFSLWALTAGVWVVGDMGVWENPD